MTQFSDRRRNTIDLEINTELFVFALIFQLTSLCSENPLAGAY